MTDLTLRDRRVFVTGGTGFLGGELIPRLLDNGANIVALVRDPQKGERLARPGVETALGDLTDIDLLRKGMRGCEIVIHAAVAGGGSYAMMYPATVTGTCNVMTAAADSGVSRVVHVSSIAVYGLAGERPLLDESMRLAAAEYPYITTKAMAEAEVRTIGAERQIEWAMMRPGMIYGPRSGMWTEKMFRLASMRPTLFVGSGEGSAMPIYVDDVVEMLLVLATHPSAQGEIFNCVMDPAPSWREFLGAYQRLTGNTSWAGIPEPLVYAASALLMLAAPRGSILRDLPDAVSWLRSQKRYSMDKARRLLGWEPRVSLDEGVARAADWLREIGALASSA